MSDLYRVCTHGHSPRQCELCEKDAEIARLTEESQCGGNVIAALNRDGGHSIAEVGYRQASEEAIARYHEMVAEIAALRERCERLAEMGRAWNIHQYDPSVGTLHRLNVAESACINHNDLTPPKETSDGH